MFEPFFFFSSVLYVLFVFLVHFVIFPESLIRGLVEKAAMRITELPLLK